MVSRWQMRVLQDTHELIALVLGSLSLVAALTLTFLRRDTPEVVAAFADRHLDAGGLLLTLHEKPDSRWQPLLEERLTQNPPPKVDLDRPTRRLLPAVLFFGLALLFPKQTPDWEATVQNVGRSTLDRLEQRLEQFEIAELLPEEEEASLRQAILDLRKKVKKGEFGATEWEAADGMNQRLNERLQRALGAAEAGLEAARRSDNSQDAAAALTPLADALTEMDRSGLLRALPRELQNSLLKQTLDAAKGQLDLPDLSPELVDALRKQMLQALEGS